MHQEPIVHSTVKTLYVSIYGNPDSSDNKEIITNINIMTDRRLKLVQKRKKKYELEIKFYDAESAKVWNASGDLP